MSNSTALKSLNTSTQEATKLVDRSKAMERLVSNKDFKLVISEGYFEQEAIRLVHLKADKASQTEWQQQLINQQMYGIGALKQYLYDVGYFGELAKKVIEADEVTRNELLEEDIQP